MRGSILRKLLLAGALLLLVALGCSDFLLSRYTADRELQHAVQVLDAQARILAPELATTTAASLSDWATRAAAQTRDRVTVIDRSGLVLADSQHDPSTMENHGHRPEVLAALAGQTGTNVRRSATIDVDLCYLAIPAALPGTPGVILRLAIPLEQIDIAKGEIRRLIVGASLIAAFFALVFAYFASRGFTRRIRRIQSFAAELVKAEYSGTLSTESDDELGDVARSLRGMAEQFRKMIRRLDDEAARRKAILSSMLEGVLAVDHNLRVTFYNAAFARAINARDSLSEGQPLLELVRDPDLFNLLKSVLSTAEPARRRLTLVAATGRIFDAQAAPLAETPAGAIVIFHDITELERLDRVRKDFVANISHELRTPLASIRGYSETLLDGAAEDPEKRRQFLEIICANTVRLADMASDLLALSEIETERETPPAERVAVRDIVVAAIHTVEAEARTRDVDVIPCDLQDACILGHRYRLEHAILNLLNNAIRFNRPGGHVRVEINHSGNSVRIVVADTGIGIPPADLPRIFERFYRVDKARSKATGGTGLGLSIVKHAVEKMSGTVTVESQLGAGTTFTLSFPEA